MAEEHAYQLQVDRACAAQSPDMLPKPDDGLSEDERLEIKRKRIESSINRFFE